MKIVLFEDAQFDALYPLTYLRPVFALRKLETVGTHGSKRRRRVTEDFGGFPTEKAG